MFALRTVAVAAIAAVSVEAASQLRGTAVTPCAQAATPCNTPAVTPCQQKILPGECEWQNRCEDSCDSSDDCYSNGECCQSSNCCNDSDSCPKECEDSSEECCAGSTCCANDDSCPASCESSDNGCCGDDSSSCEEHCEKPCPETKCKIIRKKTSHCETRFHTKRVQCGTKCVPRKECRQVPHQVKEAGCEQEEVFDVSLPAVCPTPCPPVNQCDPCHPQPIQPVAECEKYLGPLVPMEDQPATIQEANRMCQLRKEQLFLHHGDNYHVVVDCEWRAPVNTPCSPCNNCGQFYLSYKVDHCVTKMETEWYTIQEQVPQYKDVQEPYQVTVPGVECVKVCKVYEQVPVMKTVCKTIETPVECPQKPCKPVCPRPAPCHKPCKPVTPCHKPCKPVTPCHKVSPCNTPCGNTRGY